MSSLRTVMSRRARAVAGATAISLGGFAAVGFGTVRPVAAYGSGLSPRSFALPCDITVSNDTQLQAAVAGSIDDSVICISQSITLSDQLTVDDTRLTLVGDDSSIVLTAAANKRHIYSTGQADDTLTILDLTLSGGREQDTRGGGSIYSDTPDVLVQRSRFTDNVARSLSPGGGAIRLWFGYLKVIDTEFMDDTSLTGQGGAIYAYRVSVTNGTFTANTAKEGGAISANRVSVTNGTFTANTATINNGGAIDAMTVRLHDTTFTRNEASFSGGAIRAGNDVYAYSSSFSTNSAGSHGGAVYANTHVRTTDTTFSSNTATTGNGGAIYRGTAGGVVSTTGGSFTGNGAGGSGGAIFAFSNTTQLTTNGTNFIGNTSSGGGGAIHSSAGTAPVTIIGSTFAENTSTHSSGGGAINSANTLAATNSTFYRNSAPSGGLAKVSGDVALNFVTSVDDSTAGGFLVHSQGGVTLLGSVISPATNGGSACSPVADDSSYDSFVTDSSCGSGDDTVTVTSKSALGFDDTLVTDDSTGAQVLIPDDTSVLINAAPFNLVSGVTTDQLLAQRGVRGDDSTTVGAVQVLPILFTTQPADVTAAAGGSASFSVAALPGVGTSPVTFQWQTSSDGGVTWTNASGPSATTSTFTLTGLSTAQSGLRVRAVASDLRPAAGNSTAAQLTVTSTPQPVPPAPSYPPGAPRDPEAVAGDHEATITWTAPDSAGSAPITTYEVTNDVDGSTCLLTVAPDTPLTCAVTGLINGTEYRFRVRARNTSGWGAWSDWTTPVTPEPTPVTKTIVITGIRDGRVARVSGATTGIDGPEVKTRVRLQGQKRYKSGVPRQLAADGAFTWHRTTAKRVYVYFTAEGIRSNRVTIRAKDS